MNEKMSTSVDVVRATVDFGAALSLCVLSGVIVYAISKRAANRPLWVSIFFSAMLVLIAASFLGEFLRDLGVSQVIPYAVKVMITLLALGGSFALAKLHPQFILSNREFVRARIRELRREREQSLKELSELVPQFMWTTDPEGAVTYTNRQWQTYVGGSARDDVAHPQDAMVKAHWRHCLETAESFEGEILLKDRMGNYRWFLSRAVPLLDAEGKVLRWLGTTTDIHDKKLLQVELLRSNRVKDEFLATLSHELRTPLHVIVGYSDLLGNRRMTREEMTAPIAAISRNAHLLSALVGDLLDVSQIITGKAKVHWASVDIVQIAEDVLKSVSLSARTKGIHMARLSVDVGVCNINADPTRLSQVLWNLLTNAIKFTPRGGEIAVSITHVDGNCSVSISDSGIGIDSEFLPHVFDRFRQEEGGTTRKFGGLGIGLSIARSLIEQHGGQISVVSKGRNLGSVFTFKVPSNSNEVVASGCPPVQEEESESVLDGREILIIDDEPDSCLLVQVLLRQFGAIVSDANSVDEAFRLLSIISFDLIICDVSMPGKDGFDFIEEKRKKPSLEPVRTVALTAYASKEDRKRILQAGFDRYLSKPFNGAELVNTCHEMITESRASLPTPLVSVPREGSETAG